MKITVTQEDINEGSPQDPGSCPVALACIRELKLGKTDDIEVVENAVAVGRSTANGDWVTKTYKPPVKVTKFIEAFDKGKPVKPFTFTLRGV